MTRVAFSLLTVLFLADGAPAAAPSDVPSAGHVQLLPNGDLSVHGWMRVAESYGSGDSAGNRVLERGEGWVRYENEHIECRKSVEMREHCLIVRQAIKWKTAQGRNSDLMLWDEKRAGWGHFPPDTQAVQDFYAILRRIPNLRLGLYVNYTGRALLESYAGKPQFVPRFPVHFGGSLHTTMIDQYFRPYVRKLAQRRGRARGTTHRVKKIPSAKE